MIHRVLTPLDGSDDADLALQVAAEVSARHDADLEILHVGQRRIKYPDALYESAEHSFARSEGSADRMGNDGNGARQLRVLEHLGQMILDQGEKQARAQGVKSVETVIDWGDEGERILHHSQHPEADLIVMGSRGLSPLQGLFLGSVSHKVFHLARCTCVTVHKGKRKPALDDLDKILVPFDGSGHALKALDLACSIAGKFGANLKLVQVLEGGEIPEHLIRAVDRAGLDEETRQALVTASLPQTPLPGVDAAMPMISREVLRKVGNEILAIGRARAAEKGVGKVESDLLEGDPTHRILEAADENQVGLIVMGMRGLGEMAGMLMGSVSYKVNHLAPCTCIAVR